MHIQGVKNWMKERRQLFVLLGTAVMLVICVTVFKYRSGEINYYNSDATWHTLLTIEAYNETPISEHLFLPIISLGNANDKYIPWGITLSDENGNYYYTSFSAAGYFLPWLFIKLFRLPVTEGSLYIFNSILFAVSTALWTGLIYKVYEDTEEVMAISIIGMLTYISSPVLLHGMGIVYWHQSVMQVTLLLQMIAYYAMMQSDGRKMRIPFYILAFLNPYIEWTGYVANVGFAFAEFFAYWKADRKEAVKRVLVLGFITISSGCLFILHYLLRVDSDKLFETMKFRFIERSAADTVELTELFGGYFKSFLYLWVLFLILVVWNFVYNKKLQLRHGMLIFVMVFPVVENIVMKEHALTYIYDRMKCIYILSFLICEFSYCLLHNVENKLNAFVEVLLLTVIVCALNLKAYIESDDYIWKTDYRNNNKVIADYLKVNYADSLLATESNGVRGYIKLLFGRGIYEGVSPDILKGMAISEGRRYAVDIEFEDGRELYNENWNLSKITKADVYDVRSDEKTCINIQSITGSENELSGYQLADWSDANWTKGYSNHDNILLFNREDGLLIELLSKEKIISGDAEYHIEDVDFDEEWIRVLVHKDAEGCMYPAMMQIE